MQPRPLYTPHAYPQSRPLGQAPGGGVYVTEATQSKATGRSDHRGGGGGGMPQGTVTQGGSTSPKPDTPVDPIQKMRNVIKQSKQQINELNGRFKELRRDAQRSLNAGDKESYDLYVDNMVHVRLFIRKINRAITSVNLAGTSMKMNQCNAQMSGALADFLTQQEENTKVDMEEITRNYFDQQMNLESGLDAFVENMKDCNDPDGVLEDERARERAKIEADFGRKALSNAPERTATPAQNEAQLLREKLTY